ncbi:MAG TPA: group 1 truncated hemoglobin [Gammaproteobacteria bacterium]|nr:group 1 truncated hemoglobin [Gammaproteobacteria bacterium]
MKQSLYDAVGGLPTLEKVHKVFYDKIYAHPWLKQFFAGHSQQAIEGRQTSFMGEKMGGPKYLGKPLRQVHENMYINRELAELRHAILRESLQEAGVTGELAERWLKIDQAFMKQIIKPSIEAFYRDYHFTYKRRMIIPKPAGKCQ